MNYCIFFSLQELTFPFVFSFTSSSLRKHHASYYYLFETRCSLFFPPGPSASVARTSRFSLSQPSTHAPAPWRGLFLWRKESLDEPIDQQQYCTSSTGTVEGVTSFQSLHCTLTSSICGSDLLPNLFNDGQQFCIFVLRHLNARGALR